MEQPERVERTLDPPEPSTEGTDDEWIVGIDLSERSHGAMRFARWLRDHSRHPPRLRGVYVASTRTVWLEHPGVGLPGDQARKALHAAAEALGVDGAFSAFEGVPGEEPEDVLPRVAEERHATGLIVGRARERGEWSLVSLGKVTRRLLRHAPRPTVVVPPDLDEAALGQGPVVITVAPVPHAIEAVRFGWRLAQQLELPTLLIHVLPDPTTQAPVAFDPAYTYTSAALTDPNLLIARADRDLQRWLEEHDLPRLPLRTAVGRKTLDVLSVARSQHASLIVCGSRRLSLGDRIFQSSLGSDLAGHADRPVVVVPPSEEPAP